MDNKVQDIEEFKLYDLYDYFSSNLILSYKGPMDEYIIHSLGNYISDIEADNGASQSNLFKIYMELVQNVSYYSVETKLYATGKKTGIGCLVLFKKDDEYLLNIGNKVNINEISPLIKKCDKINQMERHELRDYKRKEISKPYSSSGGGNIGLIQVALSSKNPLNYKLTPITDEISFFSICVKIGS